MGCPQELTWERHRVLQDVPRKEWCLGDIVVCLGVDDTDEEAKGPFVMGVHQHHGSRVLTRVTRELLV